MADNYSVEKRKNYVLQQLVNQGWFQNCKTHGSSLHNQRVQRRISQDLKQKESDI